MLNIKCVIVGHPGIGKTTLLQTYSTGAFPQPNEFPCVFDNYSSHLMVDGKPINLGLWDCTGGEDYDRLRPLSYPQTDVFLIAFCMVGPDSLEQVMAKWWPEVSHHCPNTPIILCGTQADLKEDPTILSKLAARNLSPPTPQKIHEVIESCPGIVGFVETSSLQMFNLSLLFETACRAALEPAWGKIGFPPLKPQQPELNVALPTPDKLLSRFRQRLSNCYAQDFTDIKIVHKASGTTYKAHKIILASGSSLFYNALVTNKISDFFEESKTQQQPQKAIKTKSERFIASWKRTSKESMPKESFGRYGFVSFRVGDDIFMVGGGDQSTGYRTDMLRYNITTKAWTTTQLDVADAKQKPFPYGNFQSLVQLPDTSVLVFGGKSNGYNNDLWHFHADNGDTWKKLSCSGAIPSPRYGHTSALTQDGKTMYLFGGYDNEMGINNDFYSYDVSSSVWKVLKCDDGPSPRYGHFSATFKTKAGEAKLLIFAGRGQKSVLSDIWLLDLATSVWQEIVPDQSSAGPSGRYGFAAAIHKSMLYVFGGFDNKIVFNDIWCLPLDLKCKWQPVVTEGKQASIGKLPTAEFLGRYHHQIHIKDSGLLIIGGRNEDNSLCLSVEEGMPNKKPTETPLPAIDVLTVSDPDLLPNQVEGWLKSIYAGKSENRPRVFSQANESISSQPIFIERIKELVHERNAFSDIMLQTSDGKVCQSHRVLLAATSGHLESVFDNIKTFEPEKAYPVKFAYDDFLLLKDASSFSLDSIKKKLTPSNAYSILECSFQLQVDTLGGTVIAHLVENPKDFNPFIGLANASKQNNRLLSEYFTWYIQCHYHELKDDPELNNAPDDLKVFWVKNQWPGEDYIQKRQVWDDLNAKQLAKAQKKKENCAVQ